MAVAPFFHHDLSGCGVDVALATYTIYHPHIAIYHWLPVLRNMDMFEKVYVTAEMSPPDGRRHYSLNRG